jgi:hypothetical protein
MVLPWSNISHYAQPTRQSMAPDEWSRCLSPRPCVGEPPLWKATDVERSLSTPLKRATPLQCERRYAPSYVPPCISVATPRPLPFGVLPPKEMGARASQLNAYLAPRYSSQEEPEGNAEVQQRSSRQQRKPHTWLTDAEEVALYELMAKAEEKGKVFRPTPSRGISSQLPALNDSRISSAAFKSESTPRGYSTDLPSAAFDGSLHATSAPFMLRPSRGPGASVTESEDCETCALPTLETPRIARRTLRRSRSF